MMRGKDRGLMAGYCHILDEKLLSDRINQENDLGS